MKKQIVLIILFEFLSLTAFLLAVPAEIEFIMPWVYYFLITTPLMILGEIFRLQEEKELGL